MKVRNYVSGGEGKVELIFLKPVFKQMIWGGSRLKSVFGYDIPGDNTGECWAISAHPNGDCEIAEGRYAGKTLSWLWKEHRELFGGLPGDRFPLLVKIIDAKADLSIQVHPDDSYAAEHENGSLGKTECWYILDAPENGTIIIGHNAASKAEVRSMIEGRKWDAFIREVPVKAGDFFQINPGCVHAIKGGTLILETQQNSDITYRVYDYDRLQDGKPRQLHIQQSIDVITAPFEPADPVRKTRKEQDAETETLVTCSCYKVEKTVLHGRMSFRSDASFTDLSVLEGSGTIAGHAVRKGRHLIIPSGFGEVPIEGNMMFITSCPG